MKNLWKVLFGSVNNDRKWYKAIIWWEIRRIPYNLITLFCGLVTLVALDKMGASEPIHPAAPILYGIMANLFYTIGWMAELVLRKLNILKSENFVPLLFILGLIFTIMLTLSPILIFAVFKII